MSVVETLVKIRRDRLVHGKSIRAIAINQGVSHNRVSIILRSADSERHKQFRDHGTIIAVWHQFTLPVVLPQ